MKRRKGATKIRKKTCAMLKKADEGLDPREVSVLWYKVFVAVAKMLGFNRRSAEILYNGICYLDWDKIRPDTKELDKTRKERYEAWYYETLYCCDRWNLTRLIRCNWRFQQWYGMHE